MQTVEEKEMKGNSNFADQGCFVLFFKEVVMILHSISATLIFFSLMPYFLGPSMIYSIDFRGSLRKERRVQ